MKPHNSLDHRKLGETVAWTSIFIIVLIGGLIWSLWGDTLGGLNIMENDPQILCNRSTKEVRNVPESLKKRVYEKYGIWDRAGYVIDHKINLALGGSNDISNLAPQKKEEAKRKDLVENYLARKVCKEEITLKEARNKVLDWATTFRELPREKTFGAIIDFKDNEIYLDEEDEE